MKIANTITIGLAIIGSLGSIPTGINAIKYDLLGIARNDAEAFTRHLMDEHVLSDEVCKTATLDAKDGFAAISLRPDDCIVIKRKDSYGNVIDMKLLPPPDRADKIKELYSDNSGIAYAGEQPFDFKVHREDLPYKYDESKKGSSVLRVYKDSCILRYEFSRYGTAQNFQWIKYNHKD